METQTGLLTRASKIIKGIKHPACGLQATDPAEPGTMEQKEHTMNAKTQAAIIKHGQDLIALFKLDPTTDPVKLCKALRRWENKAHAMTTHLCNGTGYAMDPETEEYPEADRIHDNTLAGVDKLLNFKAQGIPVFINYDARGYALKIREEWTGAYRVDGGSIYTDWGGYGIIAPDLTAEGN